MKNNYRESDEIPKFLTRNYFHEWVINSTRCYSFQWSFNFL